MLNLMFGMLGYAIHTTRSKWCKPSVNIELVYYTHLLKNEDSTILATTTNTTPLGASQQLSGIKERSKSEIAIYSVEIQP